MHALILLAAIGLLLAVFMAVKQSEKRRRKRDCDRLIEACTRQTRSDGGGAL